jgi:cell surface protein SprA
MPGDSIMKLEIFFQTDEAYASKCSLYVDPVSRDSFPDGVVVRLCFDEQEYEAEQRQQVRYYYHPTEHYIRVDSPTLNRNNFSVGVLMEIVRGNDTLKIGRSNLADSVDFAILKMLKHENPRPEFITWNYVWRNVYFIGRDLADADSFYVDIFKGQATTPNDIDGSEIEYLNGETYLHLLGLDTNPKDHHVDISNQLIDFEAGHLFFPDRRPFLNPALGADTIPEIYFERNGRIKQDSSKFFLLVEIAEWLWD